LASVDLKDYILPSHEKTFLSLRDRGLIDMEKPEKSKILTLIEMGEKDLDRSAQLIHEKTRKAEYDAFAAWIKACCSNAKLRELPPLASDVKVRLDTPDRVIRYNRKDRVLDSFVRNVWSQRMRCFPCHTPHELDPDNPQHEKPIARQSEFVKKYGARINIFRESPLATMKALIVSSRKKSRRRLPLINLDEPRKSLLVLKPTSKLPPKGADGKFKQPSSTEPVSHMGGLKMHVDDQSYKSFIAWIQDYSRVVGGEYESVADLPADNWYPSKQVLRIKETPASWAGSTRVQLFVHSWNNQDKTWSSDPVAFTQNTVTPRRIVNGALFLLAPPEASRSKDWDPEGVTLAPGKYLIKAYVDSKHRLADDPTVMLGEKELYGQMVIQARWRVGFRQAEVASGRRLVP